MLYLILLSSFLRLTFIYLLSHLFILVFCFLFFCSLSIRRMHLPPVLYYLISSSLRYVSFLSFFFFFSFLHVFPLPYVMGCLIYLYASSTVMHSFLLISLSPPVFLFPRSSLSLSPYITPQLRRFLPLWAHPWKVSLIGLIWCLRSQLLPLLLLHREFLPRLLSLPPRWYP